MATNDKDARIKELEVANNAYVAEISRLAARLGELNGEMGRLQGELSQKRGVRHQTSGLYRALDLAITSRIERKGRIRKPPRRSGTVEPISPQVLTLDNVQELMGLARRYDSAAYFRYRASKSGMRLRYRVVGRVYRTSRDAAKASVKGAYRLARKVQK